MQPRMLLCMHGIGHNAGLQRMASLESGVTAKDLAYVRRRYISVDTLRRAIAIVADGTLQARNPAIWGSGTTACASDSKHYGAWDQAPELAGFPSLFYRVVGGIVDKDVSVPMVAGSALDRTRLPSHDG